MNRLLDALHTVRIQKYFFGFRFSPHCERIIGLMSKEKIGETDAQTRKALSEVQGILILRALRRQKIKLPAILGANIEHLMQVNFLEQSLAPLEVSPSSQSVMRLAERMRAFST